MCSISIDVTINAQGIVTFFEETPFGMLQSLVDRIMNKIGPDLTCKMQFVYFFYGTREKPCYRMRKIKNFIISFTTQKEILIVIKF